MGISGQQEHNRSIQEIRFSRADRACRGHNALMTVKSIHCMSLLFRHIPYVFIENRYPRVIGTIDANKPDFHDAEIRNALKKLSLNLPFLNIFRYYYS